MSGIYELKQGIIYGPVNSRRLGRSLGINLSPCDKKLCPFDCVYCHYGHTSIRSADSAKYRELFPSPDDVARAVEEALSTGIMPQYVTFSGNGEPTFHPDFPEIVEKVRQVVRQKAPEARFAVLSNSCTVADAEVRRALGLLDVRIMKLDAGNPAMFTRMNRPAKGIVFADIVDSLTELGQVTVQTLFAAGKYPNSDEAEVADWLACLKKIKPIGGQIYTADRPSASPGLEKVSRERLAEIAALATTELGVPIEAF